MSTTENLFINASRKGYRWSSTRGDIQVEDLWKLNLVEVDQIAIALKNEVANLEGKGEVTSFLPAIDEGNKALLTELKERLEIAKFVIETRVNEKKAQEDKTAANRELQDLLALVDRRNKDNLANLPDDELQKKVEALQSRINAN